MLLVEWNGGQTTCVVVGDNYQRWCVGCRLSSGVTHPMAHPAEVVEHLQNHRDVGDIVDLPFLQKEKDILQSILENPDLAGKAPRDWR